jgi:hypothetical protein
MEQQRADYLLAQYIAGQLSAAERRELKELLVFPGNKDLLVSILAGMEAAAKNPVSLDDEVTRILFRQMMDADKTGESGKPVFVRKKPPVRMISAGFKWWAAAAVFLLLATGAYLWLRPKATQPPLLAVPARSLPDVPPGKQGAILKLADGRTVVLDSLDNGVIATQGNAKVKLQDGQLNYTEQSPALQKKEENIPVSYNTMITPPGRQYRVLLPDGTRVWLNAASSLRYPTVFNGTDRQVELTGEGYFEVAKDAARPFHVKAGGLDVKVLGTHFNLMAYSDEETINTTLLEGAVQLQQGNQIRKIIPGEQAVVNSATGDIRVKYAVTEQVMAWKEGVFNFQGLRFEEVMRQLSRWYAIRVVYENGIPDMEFEGELGRDVNLSKVLFFLGKVDVHYRMEEGNRLVISR